MMRPLATFSFLQQLFYFFTLLLVPPSSPSLLPPCSSFFPFQHYLKHLESIKGHYSLILTKALRTDGRTDGPTNQRTDGRTDGPTDGRTDPLIEMRGRI